MSVERVSITPVDGENTDRIELEPTGLFDDEYSLANQDSGDYILQVLVERQGMQAGYETRLSILDEDDECDTTGGDATPDKKIIKIFKRTVVIIGDDEDPGDNQTDGNGTNGNGTNSRKACVRYVRALPIFIVITAVMSGYALTIGEYMRRIIK